MSDLLAHPLAFTQYNSRPLTRDFLVYLIQLFRDDHACDWRIALFEAIQDWNGFFISNAPVPFDEIEPMPRWSEIALELTIFNAWLGPHELNSLEVDLQSIADGRYRDYLRELIQEAPRYVGKGDGRGGECFHNYIWV